MQRRGVRGGSHHFPEDRQSRAGNPIKRIGFGPRTTIARFTYSFVAVASATARSVLAGQENGHVRLVDAPLVEGAVAAAVMASAGLALGEVEQAASEARGAAKL